MRSEKELIAAIEELQRMGDAACLNGHRPDAQALLDEWMELPGFDDLIRVVPRCRWWPKSCRSATPSSTRKPQPVGDQPVS